MALIRLAKADADGDIVDYSGNKLAKKVHGHAAADVSDLTPTVQATTAAMFTGAQGNGVSVAYNPTTKQLAITAPASTGGTGGTVSPDTVVRRNASQATRGFPTTTPIDIMDDLGTGVPPSWYQPGLDVLLSAI